MSLYAECKFKDIIWKKALHVLVSIILLCSLPDYFMTGGKFTFSLLLCLFLRFPSLLSLSLSQICVGVLIAKPAHNIWVLFESTLLFQQLGLKTNGILLVHACQSPYINASAGILVTPHKRMWVVHTHRDSHCLYFSIHF